MTSLNRRRFLETTAAGFTALPGAVGLPEAADDDPLGVRADFPVTGEMAYLNTASVGPLSRSARDALVAYADEKMTFRDPGSRRRSDVSSHRARSTSWIRKRALSRRRSPEP